MQQATKDLLKHFFPNKKEREEVIRKYEIDIKQSKSEIDVWFKEWYPKNTVFGKKDN